MKVAAIGFTTAAALLLLGSPLLFTWALGGKYDAGLAVLPGTLTYCVWYGLACLATNYLLCAEKARLATLALIVGLAINLTLNYLLAPRFGLAGVVAATIAANAAALATILQLARLAGMRWSASTWLTAALPLSLCLGGAASLAIVAVVLAIGFWEGWLLTPDERQQAATLVERLMHRGAAPAPPQPAPALSPQKPT